MTHARSFVARMVAHGHRLRGERLDLRPLVTLGHTLQREDEPDLVAFRDRIGLHPDRLRHLWLGKTALGRRVLSPCQRSSRSAHNRCSPRDATTGVRRSVTIGASCGTRAVVLTAASGHR
jgi:hypothetical protein